MNILKQPGLYKVSSPSGKSYVGITVVGFQKRYTKHLCSPDTEFLIGKAFQKYGKAMVMTPLVVCEDREALQIMERKAIELFDTLMPKGYNISSGGDIPPRENLYCKHCHKEFNGRKGVSKFCSKHCRENHRAASGVDDVTKICVGCGVIYTSSKRNSAQSCGLRCPSRKHKGRGVSVAGVYYHSIRAAGRAHGITHTTAIFRLKSKAEKFKDWCYATV